MLAIPMYSNQHLIQTLNYKTMRKDSISKLNIGDWFMFFKNGNQYKILAFNRGYCHYEHLSTGKIYKTKFLNKQVYSHHF